MLANYVDKYKDLTTRIHHLEKLYDRDIRLIVVSKTQNPEKIITLNLMKYLSKNLIMTFVTI